MARGGNPTTMLLVFYLPIIYLGRYCSMYDTGERQDTPTIDYLAGKSRAAPRIVRPVWGTLREPSTYSTVRITYSIGGEGTYLRECIVGRYT